MYTCIYVYTFGGGLGCLGATCLYWTFPSLLKHFAAMVESLRSERSEDGGDLGGLGGTLGGGLAGLPGFIFFAFQ